LELIQTAGPKSKSGSRSLETATHPVRIVHAPGGRPWSWAAICGISSEVSLCQCLTTYAALPDEGANNSGNSSERAGIENSLAALGAPFSVSRPKSCSCWGMNRDATNSTRVGTKPCWRNRKRWRVLVPIFLFLSVLKMICTIADRCHSKDASDHWDLVNYDDVFLHRT
jgi:hypothetical protein